jgi:hypothetical protein
MISAIILQPVPTYLGGLLVCSTLFEHCRLFVISSFLRLRCISWADSFLSLYSRQSIAYSWRITDECRSPSDSHGRMVVPSDGYTDIHFLLIQLNSGHDEESVIFSRKPDLQVQPNDKNPEENWNGPLLSNVPGITMQVNPLTQ